MRIFCQESQWLPDYQDKEGNKYSMGKCRVCHKHFFISTEGIFTGKQAKYQKYQQQGQLKLIDNLAFYKPKVNYDDTKYYQPRKKTTYNTTRRMINHWQYQSEHYLATDYPTGRITERQLVGSTQY